jgi:hypothetical protein
MDTNLLIIGAAGLVVVIVLLGITLAVRKSRPDQKAKRSKKELAESYEKIMQNDMYHVFGKEFQEELRNKARLDFQRVINENAMFLQQDLRLTTSGLNEYMKTEISAKLQEEFSAYQQTIKDVEQMAANSINATVLASQELQKELDKRLLDEAESRKSQIIESFQANMSEVVGYYITQAIGDQVDMKQQLPFILKQMESQMEEMRKDMWL